MIGLSIIARNQVRIASTVYDVAAETFVNATATLDNTEKGAIRTLVNNLKVGDVWSYLYVLHPYVGSSALTNSYNLVDPSLTQLTFSGGFTHDANGITPDGITGYVLTGWNPVLEGVDRRDLCVGSYATMGNTAYDMGVKDAVTNNLIGQLRRSAGSFHSGRVSSGALGTPPLGAAGLSLVQRNATTLEYVQGASIVASGTEGIDFADGDEPNEEMYYCAINNNGTPAVKSNARFSTHFISRYLNAARKTALDSALTTFHTTLGRNL